MNTSLLGSTSRIETPFIKVTIGKYTFGVYHKEDATIKDNNNFYTVAKIQYPNYIQSLSVEKINGRVNQYSLTLIYPIRPGDDPNFFEKVFSSVSKTREIIFSYGDISLPTFIYRNEKALITDINTSFNLKGNSITYTVSAVSSATLGQSGVYSFPYYSNKKPSDLIWEILKNPTYGLQEIFYGMLNEESVRKLGLIPGNDQAVKIEAQENIAILDYLNYLVACMIPQGEKTNSNQQTTFYVLGIYDEIGGSTSSDNPQAGNIITESLGGPYFKISTVNSKMQHSDAYEIDIGFPTANIVTSFNISNNENYSIYYDWQSELNEEDFVLRLNDEGEWEKEYAPRISSSNNQHVTRTSDKTWWTKITQYPISANLTIKGLLRPATLMQYVKLNVLFFGIKHISSGTYIVTKQLDQIDRGGFRTTLNLTRVVGESEDEYDY